MRVSEYIDIVRSTDQFSANDLEVRRRISLYGLVGEIGSLTSAVKKAKLGGYGDVRNEEIEDEIGDVFWYLFHLSIVLEIDRQPDNILKQDIAHITKEVTEANERGEDIREVLKKLDGERLENFKKRAAHFRALDETDFDDYQKTAYLTARTEGHVLNDVCLAVLWQLGAELLRRFTMPSTEWMINEVLPLRKPEIVIGEIAWHLAAIASVHKVSLNDALRKNESKANFRSRTEGPVPYYDEGSPDGERLPRKFRIDFVSTGPKHARMYHEGRPLGDDLTDNTYEEDGYRFHDVMHLANAACLRWSPVMRKLLKRKRKYSQETDEVEDGARAQIVEELVVKAIHTVGKKLLPAEEGNKGRLFREMGDITFGLIKTMRAYVEGLEVHDSQEWQWRRAIFEGYRVYERLRDEGQGSVTVDLEDQSLAYDPRLRIGMAGIVRELGGSTVAIETVQDSMCWVAETELGENEDEAAQAEVIAAKKGIMNALGLSETEGGSLRGEIALSRLDSGEFSVKAAGQVQDTMWEKGIIEFKCRFNRVGDVVVCVVLGVGDPKDVMS